MPFLTIRFCREQSIVTRLKPLKKEFNCNDGSFFHEGFGNKTYRNVYISYKTRLCVYQSLDLDHMDKIQSLDKVLHWLIYR